MTPAQFKAAIEQMGLSQGAVAGELGLHIRTINAWANSDRHEIPRWLAHAIHGLEWKQALLDDPPGPHSNR